MLETQFTLLETQFVRVSHFQKSACLFTFISGNFLPTVDKHTFLRFFFQKCKMSMEFSNVPSLEVGLEAFHMNHKF